MVLAAAYVLAAWLVGLADFNDERYEDLSVEDGHV